MFRFKTEYTDEEQIHSLFCQMLPHTIITYIK